MASCSLLSAKRDNRHEARALAENDPQRVAGLRAEREANAELARPLKPDEKKKAREPKSPGLT